MEIINLSSGDLWIGFSDEDIYWRYVLIDDWDYGLIGDWNYGLWSYREDIMYRKDVREIFGEKSF